MEKFIIIWDAGFGESADIVSAKSHEDAERCAYEAWKEDAETNASYKAVKFNKEIAIGYDLIDEDEED